MELYRCDATSLGLCGPLRSCVIGEIQRKVDTLFTKHSFLLLAKTFGWRSGMGHGLGLSAVKRARPVCGIG